MSWLFKKKVVPRVPFPGGRPFDEKELRFAPSALRERVIEPEPTRQTSGFGKPLSFPDNFDMHIEGMEVTEPKLAVASTNIQGYSQNLAKNEEFGPTYVKVDVYQHLLGEIDGLKTSLSALTDVSRALEKSEYNEEASFEKLKRDIKSIHDKLLHVDKRLFKYQGE